MITPLRSLSVFAFFGSIILVIAYYDCKFAADQDRKKAAPTVAIK